MVEKATLPPLRAAASIYDRAASIRRSHVGAASQPSSSRTSVGAEDKAAVPAGLQTGPAMAKTNAAAKASLMASSHQGVLEGVSSSGRNSRRIFVGGKTIWRGRGGVTRSSQ